RRGAGQAFAVRTKGHAGDPSAVPLQGEDLLAGLGIPNLHCLVTGTAGEALAVRTEGHAAQPAVRFEGDSLVARLQVPQLDHSSTTAGQAFAVRAERHARGGTSASVGNREGKENLASLRFPQIGRKVVCVAN